MSIMNTTNNSTDLLLNSILEFTNNGPSSDQAKEH